MIELHDLELVRRVVKVAAEEELLARFTRVRADIKTDGSLITEADLAMQNRLQRDLAAHWPEHALLGEEMTVDEQQQLLAASGRPLWCLDPLDGTSNYAAGIPFFGVSLALIADGMTRAAVVYDPSRDECFSALRGRGAWLNGTPLLAPHAPATLSESIAMVDLKRLPGALVSSLAQNSPYRSQRSFGSVALDWCWVASGRCQVYLHGGQRLWDYAAGQLILSESGAVGGLLNDYAGDWLDDLSLKPRIALAATHADLLAQWRAWVSAGIDG
jgi:myo-inositol-1(or 4)-monophosphatase